MVLTMSNHKHAEMFRFFLRIPGLGLPGNLFPKNDANTTQTLGLSLLQPGSMTEPAALTAQHRSGCGRFTKKYTSLYFALFIACCLSTKDLCILCILKLTSHAPVGHLSCDTCHLLRSRLTYLVLYLELLMSSEESRRKNRLRRSICRFCPLT